MLNKLLPGMLFILSACQPDSTHEVVESPQYRINHDRITVSGVSSGAYMAGQMHVAHSATFNGAALLAGGPFWCAENSLKQAIGPCVKGGEINFDSIADFVETEHAAGRIDNPENLANDRVWLFHGTSDAAVSLSVSEAAKTFYSTVLSEKHIRFVSDIDAVHGMPTLDAGLPCNEFGEPYINACNYDAAGEMLATLYGELEPRVDASGDLLEIQQANYSDAELLRNAYLYVPSTCNDGQRCGLHVAFHGCKQSAEFIADAFARSAGFNEWAESNELLVLYPQVGSSKIAPMNPMGCWDWWGYTGDNYATTSGVQIAAVMSMIKGLEKPSQ